MDIVAKGSYQAKLKDSFFYANLTKYYSLYSSAPDLWKEVFTAREITETLRSQAPYLFHYYLRGEYLEVLVNFDGAIINFLNLTMQIHSKLKDLFGVLETYKTEKLVCYNCQDPFDPLEEVCDKCGSPRPRCIVCLLDLRPSQIDEEIVTLPYCGVYAHKAHIIVWLKQNPHCPNCHRDLRHWLGQIQM